MSKPNKANVRTLTITFNGALIIFNACNAPKVFTEALDLGNAYALLRLLEKRVPNIRKLESIPNFEEWLQKTLTIKLGDNIYATAKKGVDALRAQGSLTGTKGVYDLLSTLEIITDNTQVDDLLALNEDEPGVDPPVDPPANTATPTPPAAPAAG
ncbi:MAG: hypothetical protein WC869_00815 [Phycisphaerae bacterium]|jgi:hypothetical protein